MGVDAVAEPPRLTKHSVRHEVVVSIAQGSVRGEVGDGRVSAGGPGGLAEGVRKSNGGSVVAGQIGICHGLVAVVLKQEIVAIYFVQRQYYLLTFDRRL